MKVFSPLFLFFFLFSQSLLCAIPETSYEFFKSISDLANKIRSTPTENEKINGKFLYYILKQDRIVEQMVLMSDKGQYPSITASDLGEIEIPLPPLDIQQQIV